MYKNFLDKEIYVTKLNRIIFVDKNEYPEKKTDFGTKLCGNEIIFHFSGHATVFFDDNVFETKDPITKLTIASTKPLMPTNRIIKFKTFVLPN